MGTFALLATVSLAQQGGGNTDPGTGGPGDPGSGFTGPEGIRTEFREQIQRVRQQRLALHEELMQRLDELPEDATEEEVQAVREQFFADRAAEIERIRSQNQQLRREAIQQGLGGNVSPPARKDFVNQLPEALQEQIAAHREAVKDLRTSWQDYLAEQFGEDGEPTPEEIREARQTWADLNAETIAAVRDEGQAIRDEVRTYREENGLPVGPGGIEPSPEMRQLRGQLRAKQGEMLQRRQQLREDMQGVDPEERRQMLREFREEQRQRRAEIRELRREMRQQDDRINPGG